MVVGAMLVVIPVACISLTFLFFGRMHLMYLNRRVTKKCCRGQRLVAEQVVSNDCSIFRPGQCMQSD